MGIENVNAEALNAGLNTPTDEVDDNYQNDDSYSPNDEPEEQEAVEPEEESVEVATAAETGHQNQEEEDEPKPLTRGQQRIQALANEKKLAEQRAELLERQLAELNQQRQQVARQAEEENLTELEKWQRQADLTIRQVQIQNMDMADRSDFLQQVSKNPAEAAYIDRVEQTLAEARKQGFNPRREDVLIRLMGLDARNKMKSAPAVKRDAAQRVKAATGKPIAAKSNVAPSKTESTAFDRLKGIIL